MSVNAQVREAIGRIEPLSGRGPNMFTVDVDGWGLSAPTRPELARMLWHWFNMPRDDDEPHPQNAGGACLKEGE